MTSLHSLPFGLALSVLLTALAASACSGGSTTTGGGRSGVAESKRVTDLSSTEAAQLCDFMANQLGGYGYSSTAQCDGGTAKRTAPKSQSSCVDGVAKVSADCLASVSDVEGCISALAATPACDRTTPTSCSAISTPSCGSSTTTTTMGDPETADAATASSCAYRCVGDACTCDGGSENGRACQQKSSSDPVYCGTFCCQ